MSVGKCADPPPGRDVRNVVIVETSRPAVSQTNPPLRPSMADAEEQVTSAEATRNLLSSARVPDMLVEHILGLGFEDIADFAYAYADASDLSKLLDGVPAETWTSMSRIQSTRYLRHALGELLPWPRPLLRKNPWP